MFLAGLIKLDPALRQTLSCALTSVLPEHCPRSYTTVVVAQAALLVTAVVLCWFLGYSWSGRYSVAWATFAAALLSGIHAGYVAAMLTEALALPLVAAFTLMWCALVRNPRPPVVVAVSVSLALLVLTRPSFWYLLWFMPMLAAGFAPSRNLRRLCAPIMATFALALLLTSSWLVRNYLVSGHATVSGGGYGGRVLVQRVSYNDMTLREFGAAFIFWLPEFGDSLARAILPRDSYARLGWGDDSLYAIGWTRMRAKLGSTAQPRPGALWAIIHQDVLARPIAHLKSTIALTWRGMFIGKMWGLVGWLCAAAILWRTLRRGHAAYALAVVPAAFMLILHAAVSVNIPRYNFMLLPPLALAVGLVAAQLITRGRKRAPDVAHY